MVLIINSLPQTMTDFPTLNTFLNEFGHLSKTYNSVQPKVVGPRYSHCLEVPLPLWNSSDAVDAHAQCLSQATPALEPKEGSTFVCLLTLGKRRQSGGRSSCCLQAAGAPRTRLCPQPAPDLPRVGSRHQTLPGRGHPACCLPPPGNTQLCSFRLMQSTLHQAISDGK